VEFHLKSGRTFTGLYFAVPVEIAGEPCLLSLIMDITERKQVEEARRARQAVEEASRAKSEFLSRMSHELRTPLNSILGFAQLLDMDDLTPEQHENLDFVVKAGRHLLDLINEVLDIARIEEGRVALSIEPISVEDVLQECVDLIQPMAAYRDLWLKTNFLGARGRNNWHVLADRQKLKQVLLNLLSNAVKYNREGGSVSLSVSPVHSAASSREPGTTWWTGEAVGRLRIEVADTGPGISPEGLERLFTPFERLAADQSGVEGTGLGLALSKRLVEAMGGTIGVKSTVGRGSAFWVELPLVEGQIERLDRVDSGPLIAGGEANRAPTRVLYIEDNLANLRLIERILQYRPEIELMSAMQGGLGFELARRHYPDLILLDLHLPDMPGEQVLRRLKSEQATGAIPVVVISADAIPRDVERLLNAGAQAYLTKPLDVKQFIQVLDDILKERSGVGSM
jgi:signal transduction histidine kinase/ActR/RegA family two-component response regulator